MKHGENAILGAISHVFDHALAIYVFISSKKFWVKMFNVKSYIQCQISPVSASVWRISLRLALYKSDHKRSFDKISS